MRVMLAAVALSFLAACGGTTENNDVGTSAIPEQIPAADVADGGGLAAAEYACFGSGGQSMMGLAFKVVPGGRYTTLDGGQSGTYRVSGDTVTFIGGHLDGQTGRNLNNNKFSIGMMAECEPSQ